MAGVVGHAAVLGGLVGVVGVHPAEGLLVGDVLHHADALLPGLGPAGALLAGGHLDLGRVRLAQGELVPPQVQLQRVAEGGHLAHRHLRAGGEAHVHQPALHRPVLIAHLENDPPLAGCHVLQGFPRLFRLCPRHMFIHLK